MPLLSVDSCASIRPSGSCGSPRADVPHVALRDDEAPEEVTDDGAPAGGAAAADDCDELGDGVGIGGGSLLRHDGSVTSQVSEVMQHHGLPQGRRQLPERTHQVQREGVGTGYIIRNEIAAQVQQAFRPPPPADRQVPGDAAHPANRIVERGHRRPLREGTRERLLHQVLRVGPVPANAYSCVRSAGTSQSRTPRSPARRPSDAPLRLDDPQQPMPSGRQKIPLNRCNQPPPSACC